jgi:hypothetical protein
MANCAATSEERVLLVEGQDDLHVVYHLRRTDSQMPPFCIRSKGGIDDLLRGIRGEVLTEDRAAVGVLVDANDDLRSRWQAVAYRLRDAGITPPVDPDPNGTIIDGIPRVGIWLMPDNESPGELEDFVARMIPCDDAVWPLSRHYIDGIPATHRRFKQGKILRAEVHAWLAAREEPRRMGSAIGAGDLDVDGEVSQKFVSWLRELFK